MKYISKFLFLSAIVVFTITACKKVENLPNYGAGTPITATASATTITALPADSNSVALTLNWTYPAYANDSTTTKYVVEMDVTGNNFSKASSKTIIKSLSTTYIAKELNKILLDRGYPFNVPVDMDVRIISSYGNNNERIISNTLNIKITPYKVPPKVALPASGKLFIVGGATVGGWSNPVPAPSQELARLDETTFGGVFQLTAGQSYLILPVNGSWDAKFGFIGNNNQNNPLGDDFKNGGGDLLSPPTSGWYKIIFDFQSGKFTVTEFTQQHAIPANLFIVGGATPGGWSNPVPLPSQQFTRLNSVQYEIASLALITGEKYLFLLENGNWGMKYGAVNGSAANIGLGGPLAPEGQDMPAPSTSGNYKISVNLINNTYTLVKL